MYKSPPQFYNLPRIVDLVAGERPFQNWSPHVSNKALAAAWQVWDSGQEGAEDTIHIDYTTASTAPKGC